MLHAASGLPMSYGRLFLWLPDVIGLLFFFSSSGVKWGVAGSCGILGFLASFQLLPLSGIRASFLLTAIVLVSSYGGLTPSLFCLALKSQLTCDILHGGLWFLVILHIMAVILILLSLVSLY